MTTSQERRRRCPACGHRLPQPLPERCPLCDFQVSEEVVTAEDRTPYALSERYGRKAWWATWRWLWGAGRERLGHLGLMRSSSASRRFARVVLARFAAVLTLCALALAGWHAVTPTSLEEAINPGGPSGRGWLPVARAPEELAPRLAAHGGVAALWWNPAQALVGATIVLVTVLVLGKLMSCSLRRGVERSLGRRHRGQMRLSAALEYAAAWSVPLIPAALVLALLPLCRVAAVADWMVQPGAAVVYVPAGALAALGVLAWWFGVARLALTVPVAARRRVFLFSVIWFPLGCAVVLAGVVLGWLSLRDRLVPLLGLQW